MHPRRSPLLIRTLRIPLRTPSHKPASHRPFSTPPAAPPPRQRPSTPPQPHSNSSRLRSRLQTFNNRAPRFLRSYTTPLLNAPVTHVTSFLILHEITAVVPLLGLTGAFHYWGWIPALGDGTVDEGVKKFGRWLRKKGWVEQGAEMQAEAEVEMGIGMGPTTAAGGGTGGLGGIADTDKGVQLILEFATAYAITKAMLPVRIMLSVWATPWFARGVVGPVGRGVGRVFGKNGG
ncbi:hypothetical protein AJ78_06175 [Emergomyces pasteurianus Ep9510]|uniref:Uncharacterized protein n=1 Tax=Emergomyces pasteurianus Ep9510 TaxID=1447872 RepID=A0A1J9PZP0_9EURO|nr:hypothetical protein AJ78_06175 [Emergomyces pasteurianus Ep9510]